MTTKDLLLQPTGIYLGVSGSHRQSVAIAVDQDYRVVGSADGLSLNIHACPFEEVRDRLSLLLHALCQDMQMPREDFRRLLRHAVFSIPGCTTELETSMMSLCVRFTRVADDEKFHVVDDTWAGLVGGIDSLHGICAFGGTGASVFVGLGELVGRPNKFDGWGPILGDCGSGFELACSFMRFLCRSIDRGESPRLLDALLKAHPEIQSSGKIQRWFDELCIRQRFDWRKEFATLATIVTESAEALVRDQDAVKLVKQSATAMVDTISIARHRVGEVAQSLPIVFQGGMFEFSKLYRNTVSDELKLLGLNGGELAQFRPSAGAVLMAAIFERSIDSASARVNLHQSLQEQSPKVRSLTLPRSKLPASE